MIYTPLQIKQRIANRDDNAKKTGVAGSIGILGEDLKIALTEILDCINVTIGASVQKAGDTMTGDLSTGTTGGVKLKGISQGTSSLGNIQYNNYIAMSNTGVTGVGMRIYSEKVLTPTQNSTSIFSPQLNSQVVTDGTIVTMTILNTSRFTASYQNSAGINASIEAANSACSLLYVYSGGSSSLIVSATGISLNTASSAAILKTTNLTNVRTHELADVTGTPSVLSAGTTPASASAAGVKGEVRTDGTYLYLCVATNTWLRSSMASW